jgi:hypothetical protein
LYEQYRQRIEALAAARANFDLDRMQEYTTESGWHVDDYQTELPPEPPGEPIAGGSWEVARAILRDYKFPDPSLITGIFIPDQPIEQRVMLLRGRFLGFTFYFGVRVGAVIDTTRQGEHTLERVWGFSYQTLEGHFERGQADFSVAKLVESGQVLFRIHAVSQMAEIANPFYKLGFRLFGRSLQRRFARTAQERMRRLVEEQLAAGRRGAREIEDAPPVMPAEADAEASEKLEEVGSDTHGRLEDGPKG